MSDWWQVKLPYATYGIKVEDGRVTVAAPIARWMVGRDFYDVVQWVERKGGTVWQV